MKYILKFKKEMCGCNVMGGCRQEDVIIFVWWHDKRERTNQPLKSKQSHLLVKEVSREFTFPINGKEFLNVLR